MRIAKYTRAISSSSTVTCIGYVKRAPKVSYAVSKTLARNQAKALCTSMKKINKGLKTKTTVYPISKAPKSALNKKWNPVSYRIDSPIN